MKKYYTVWSSATINPNATVIRRSDFTKMKEIVNLLQYSYVIPLEEGSSIIPRRSKRGLSEESSSEELRTNQTAYLVYHLPEELLMLLLPNLAAATYMEEVPLSLLMVW